MRRLTLLSNKKINLEVCFRHGSGLACDHLQKTFDGYSSLGSSGSTSYKQNVVKTQTRPFINCNKVDNELQFNFQIARVHRAYQHWKDIPHKYPTTALLHIVVSPNSLITGNKHKLAQLKNIKLCNRGVIGKSALNCKSTDEPNGWRWPTCGNIFVQTDFFASFLPQNNNLKRQDIKMSSLNKNYINPTHRKTFNQLRICE